MNRNARWNLLIGSLAIAVSIALATPSAGHDMADMHGDMGEMGEMEMSHNGHDAHLMAMKNMSLHMAWSDTRPETPADAKRAEQIVAELRTALAKYKDYRVAEQDGYKPFHPEFKQGLVHFTRNWNAIKAAFTFDPAEPTSLLYKPTADGGYELVGAMYTAPKRATEAQLDQRVPLSIARWHRHVNLCFPARGVDMKTADWTKFGTNGSIATKEACDAAGGRFVPQLFGWMVHVYPWDTNPKEVWAH